jgi:eukaryotic-like serine/threonine-protein kinase
MNPNHGNTGDPADLADAEGSEQERVGHVLADKYRLVRMIGRGGMGAVYEAQHARLKRRFAIKFLYPELARRHDVMVRFEREAEAAGALENENIAAALDFGHATDGAPYIVMEYLQGEDLARLLGRAGPLPVQRAVRLIVQACCGLEAAHAKGIVHRDLKPQNLFICRRNDGSDLVKVLDFGVAKLRDAESSPLHTRSGALIGTPAYMPPEQVRGAKLIDSRADVYALGVILYELLTGNRPHPGNTHHEVFYHLVTEPPVPLESLRPNLPAALCDIVHRALALEPADRFADAASFRSALMPFTERPAAVPGDHPADARTMPAAPSLPSTPASEASALDLPIAISVAEPVSHESPAALPAPADSLAGVGQSVSNRRQTRIAIGAAAILAALVGLSVAWRLSQRSTAENMSALIATTRPALPATPAAVSRSATASPRTIALGVQAESDGGNSRASADIRERPPAAPPTPSRRVTVNRRAGSPKAPARSPAASASGMTKPSPRDALQDPIFR